MTWLLHRTPAGGCLLVFNGKVDIWRVMAAKSQKFFGKGYYIRQLDRKKRGHTRLTCDFIVERKEDA